MKNPVNVIGPQVRQFRNAKGLSQPQFAALLQRKGWPASRGLVAKIETGERRAADFEAAFLASALGVSVQELYPQRKAGEVVFELITRLEKTRD